MIQTGLIGFGLAGSAFHAPLITAVEGLDLVAVATSRKESVRQTHPNCRVFDDPAKLIDDPSIGLVVIATPNESHAPLAHRALERGKHVVVDKPFVTDPAAGTSLIALARAQGLVLSVFHNRRWDGDFLTVRNLVESGWLGTVRLAEMHWDRLRPDVKSGWRETPGDGAGLLADLGPHLIDQALQLFGTPDRVAGDIAIQRTGAMVDDYFALTLVYPQLRVLLSASTLVAAPRPRFGLHGTEGSFVKYGLDPQEMVLRAGGGPEAPEFGIESPNDHGLLTFADGRQERIATERGNWRHFYQALVAAIREGAPPPVDPADALDGLRLIALARRSATATSGQFAAGH